MTATAEASGTTVPGWTRAAASDGGRSSGHMTTIDTDVSVLFRPIIDVSRGTAAGYQARALSLAARVLDAAGGSFGLDPASQMDPGQLAVEAAAAITAALGAAPTLPPNTFLAVPVPVQLAAHPHVHATLTAQASLSGVVLDIVGVPATRRRPSASGRTTWSARSPSTGRSGQ